MEKPIILLTPSHESGDEKVFLKFSYVDAVIASGALPLALMLSEDEDYISSSLRSAHGLFLTGGDDIAPELYGEKKSGGCGPVSTLRDSAELKAVKIALELGMPVLGVCRGMQVMNVALGGTLYQDMPGHRQSRMYHEPHHTVTVSGPLTDIYPQCAHVNSFHHQAVKKPAVKLGVCAVSDDGYVEGIYLPGHPFFVGVQWHPERMMNDASAVKLFCEFTRKCAEYSEKGKQKC